MFVLPEHLKIELFCQSVAHPWPSHLGAFPAKKQGADHFFSCAQLHSGDWQSVELLPFLLLLSPLSPANFVDSECPTGKPMCQCQNALLLAHKFQRRTRKKYSSMALSNMTTQTTQANINNNNGGGSSSVHSSLHHGRPCSSRPSHSSSQSNNPPAYRLQKQSTLSLREALLRQSGAELDDLPALTIEAPILGRPANGPQSARPVVFIS